MRKIYKSRAVVLFVVLVGLFSSVLLSCKEEEKVFAALSSVDRTIELGESYQYNIQYTAIGGASADGITAEWSVKNDSILSIDNTGKVRALEVGTTVVTAKLSNGDYMTSNVTVVKPSAIKFMNGDDIYVQPNGLRDTVRLDLVRADLDVEAGIKIESMDSTIAEVNDPTPDDAEDFYFLLKPGKEGDTRIYVTCGEKKTYCNVHVGPVVKLAWDLSMNTIANSMQIYLQDEPMTLIAYTSVLPDNSSNYWQRDDLYVWKVVNKDNSNPAAEFSNFDQSKKNQISWTVTPKAMGTTKFYVRSRGQEISLVLKVSDKNKVKVNSLTIKNLDTDVAFASKDSVFVGTVNASSNRFLPMEVITNPQSAAGTWPVKWATTDPNVVYYDEEMKTVRTKADGEAYLSVYTDYDAEMVAKCKVIVKTAITSISIDSDSRSTIMAGESEQFSFTTTPAGMMPAVIWKSTDENVVSVDENGLLTAHNPGTADITVETVDGVKSEPRTITVVEPLSDYDYSQAQYLYDFAAGNLSIQAQNDGQEMSTLTATLSVGSLDNGTYTIGDNMANVKFNYSGVTANVTEGTITVSGDRVKEFDINLKIGLEGGKSITLSGKLVSSNYAG